MAIELRALGTKCNIGCLYCYQNPLRDSGNGNATFNTELVKKKLVEFNEPFVLWGGEPLLLDINILIEMFEFGNERFKQNSILTNGILITPAHIELFKKFNVRVVVSVDGDGELNDARWNGTIEKTRDATTKTIKSIVSLINEGIPVSLNIQVTKCNSSIDRLPKMFKWLHTIDKLKITNARLHILEVDYSKDIGPYGLSLEENIYAFSKYLKFEKNLKFLKFDLFQGIKNQLLVNGMNNDCVWGACDPYSTESVKGMDGQGRLNNCGLTDKEGINFQKPVNEGYERYIALFQTPQENGGCKNCRFFVVCKGQCPGTAINGDWRNRSGNCGVWKQLFTEIEAEISSEGNIAISLSQNLSAIENQMVTNWIESNNSKIGEYI